jgi:hypothetical protein
MRQMLVPNLLAQADGLHGCGKPATVGRQAGEVTAGIAMYSGQFAEPGSAHVIPCLSLGTL